MRGLKSMNNQNQTTIRQAITGNLTQKDIFFWTFILLGIAYVLVTLNTVSPSSFTSVYVIVFIIAFIGYMGAVLATYVPAIKALPIASIGLGNLNEKRYFRIENFYLFAIIGIMFGIFLVINVLIPNSVVAVTVPNLGVKDALQNSFLSSFLVPITEEMTTASIILPSLSNMIAQGGLMVLFLFAGSISFFWFAGYNLFSAIVLIVLGFVLGKYEVKAKYLIIALAILGDGLFFTVLHTNVYNISTDPTNWGRLAKVLTYRVIADIIVVATASIIPTIIAHSINNAVSISFVGGTWTMSPVIAFAPVVVLFLIFYAIKESGKIKVL